MSKTASALLREAAALVAEADAKLNLQSSNCSQCGMTHYTALDDARVHDRIGGLPGKLRELARRLENKERRGAARSER